MTMGENTPSGHEINQAELRTALDQVVLDSLRPVAVGVGALYAFFTVAHVLLLPPNMAILMSPIAAVTVVAMVGLYLALGRRRVPSRWAHPLGAVVAAFVLLNTLSRLYLDLRFHPESGPLQTSNVMLLIVGAGALLLSARWLALVVGVSIAGVLGGMWLGPASNSWQHFMFSLLSATVLSVIVHIARVRTTRRLESLRMQDERQKAELAGALDSAEKARRSLETVIAVEQRIASILNLDTLLSEVAELIKERFGYYYVGILLLDENKTALTVRAGTGEAGRALSQAGFRLEVGKEGIVAWVAQSGRAARVDDVSRDSRYMLVASIPDTRSELALPLKLGQDLLGVLDIQSDRLAAFSAEDVPFMQSLADQVSIAIQNASLYEREKTRRRFSETLYRAGSALSGTLDPKKLLELVLEYLAEIVSYDRASVMLPTTSNDEMEFVASRGFPPGLTPQMRILITENDLYERIYTTQQPLLIPDVSKWPGWQYVEGLPEARAWMGVPLVRAGQVVGMLSLARERPDPYNDEEVSLTISFAGQAAIALQNARLYDQLSRAFDQLERLDRTKSDFIAVVAHELRTPLTILSGSSQVLLNDQAIGQNELHRQMLDSINTGAARMHEIVNTMLDMVKIDSRTLQVHPKPMSIPEQLQVVCGGFKEVMAERGLTLRMEAMDDLPEIEADRDLLRKALYQLIVNAIKYTPDGGQITIWGQSLQPGQKVMPNGGVEIVVSDTGIGIDPAFHELIFEKFYQTGEVALHSSGKTKFKGGGPGLGLAIAQGIVEVHGGKLWVDSPGHDEENCPGSHFHIVLPLRQSANPPAEGQVEAQ
ncbi:MAG: GAF domain-containing sensor histidine kinase [Thermoflexales bacterium]|nr:GAF domain-containing sensor histidine kinase [Thermoflexales bacterium]